MRDRVDDSGEYMPLGVTGHPASQVVAFAQTAGRDVAIPAVGWHFDSLEADASA